MIFKDRIDAGRQLGKLLYKYKDQPAIVFGLPRGGVVLAAEIAKAINAPLSILLAHKIGHPYQPEYAIAAVSESGQMVLSAHTDIGYDEWIQEDKPRQMKEMQRRRKEYLKGRKDDSLEGKIAILVDDGIATGLTMQVAIMELKTKHPLKIVATVPVSPKSTAVLIRGMVDEFVAVDTPEDYSFLGSVGAYYEYFPQVEDEEVIAILENQKR